MTLRTASVLAIAATLSCGGRETPQSPAATAQAPEAAAVPASTAIAGGDTAPLARSSVTLYFPSTNGDRLVAETREVVETARAVDRGTQILAELLEGPRGEGMLAAVPEGTTLRRLWLRDDGIAFADFSEELAGGLAGGSADEILAVYAIVDSLAANVPEIRRVEITVGGRERDTLNGHVDLRHPLLPDMALAGQPKGR